MNPFQAQKRGRSTGLWKGPHPWVKLPRVFPQAISFQQHTIPCPPSPHFLTVEQRPGLGRKFGTGFSLVGVRRRKINKSHKVRREMMLTLSGSLSGGTY